MSDISAREAVPRPEMPIPEASVHAAPDGTPGAEATATEASAMPTADSLISTPGIPAGDNVSDKPIRSGTGDATDRLRVSIRTVIVAVLNIAQNKQFFPPQPICAEFVRHSGGVPEATDKLLRVIKSRGEAKDRIWEAHQALTIAETLEKLLYRPPARVGTFTAQASFSHIAGRATASSAGVACRLQD